MSIVPKPGAEAQRFKVRDQPMPHKKTLSQKKGSGNEGEEEEEEEEEEEAQPSWDQRTYRVCSCAWLQTLLMQNLSY